MSATTAAFKNSRFKYFQDQKDRRQTMGSFDRLYDRNMQDRNLDPLNRQNQYHYRSDIDFTTPNRFDHNAQGSIEKKMDSNRADRNSMMRQSLPQYDQSNMLQRDMDKGVLPINYTENEPQPEHLQTLNQQDIYDSDFRHQRFKQQKQMDYGDQFAYKENRQIRTPFFEKYLKQQKMQVTKTAGATPYNQQAKSMSSSPSGKLNKMKLPENLRNDEFDPSQQMYQQQQTLPIKSRQIMDSSLNQQIDGYGPYNPNSILPPVREGQLNSSQTLPHPVQYRNDQNSVVPKVQKALNQQRRNRGMIGMAQTHDPDFGGQYMQQWSTSQFPQQDMDVRSVEHTSDLRIEEKYRSGDQKMMYPNQMINFGPDYQQQQLQQQQQQLQFLSVNTDIAQKPIPEKIPEIKEPDLKETVSQQVTTQKVQEKYQQYPVEEVPKDNKWGYYSLELFVLVFVMILLYQFQKISMMGIQIGNIGKAVQGQNTKISDLSKQIGQGAKKVKANGKKLFLQASSIFSDVDHDDDRITYLDQKLQNLMDRVDQLETENKDLKSQIALTNKEGPRKIQEEDQRIQKRHLIDSVELVSVEQKKEEYRVILNKYRNKNKLFKNLPQNQQNQ